MAKRTHQTKGRLWDARGRFLRKVPLLDDDEVELAQALLLTLEDPDATCLTIRYAVAVYASFWGEGVNSRPKE